jgi:hypothetical protein
MVATYHRHMPEPAEPTTHLGMPASGFRHPSFELTDSTVVVCEWFRVVERLDPPA